MPTPVPPIHEFPKDGQQWRIDWLGSIERNDNVASEPTIEVIVSPVREGVTNPSKEADVLGNKRKSIRIGIGQLPFLQIGSLWQDRRVLPTAAGTKFVLRNILVTPKTASIINTGHALGANRYVIPPFLYKVGGRGLDAKCLAIHYNDDPYGIILPVAEAIRFYYAASSDLAHVAIQGAYEHSLGQLINPTLSGFDILNRRCILRLRQWLADDDGWTIGRILHDPIAAIGVKRIHDSIIRTSTNRTPKYPECGLPFQGTVRWIARGLLIPNQGKTRYLIFELQKCSSRFPFSELEVSRDNDGTKANPATDIPEWKKRPAWARPRKASTTNSAMELQSRIEPRSFTEPVTILLGGERFDALEGKKVIRDPKKQTQFRSARWKPLQSFTSGCLGTGRGTGGETDAAPAEVVIARQRRKGLPPSFDILTAATRILNSYDGVTASLRQLYAFPITLPNQAQWAYLDSADRIPRRVMAADIEFKGCYFCFIEFEQRPSEHRAAGLVSNSNGEQINESQFERVLYILVETKGIWDVNRFLDEGWICRRLKHTWPNEKACANKIKAKLDLAFLAQ